MWKCVKCEMNNPDDSGSCFICGTEKSYSLRLTEEMKKYDDSVKENAGKHIKLAADAVPHEKEEKSSGPVKGDIFGDAVYTRIHEPYPEEYPPSEEIPAFREGIPYETHDHDDDDDFLIELKKEQQEKRSKRIKIILFIIAITIFIFLIVAIICEREDGYETDPETADPVVYIREDTDDAVGIETTDKSKYIIIKDV